MPKSTTIQSILSALQTDRHASGVFDAHQVKIHFQAQENQIHLRGVLCGADCRPISGARDVTRTITSETLLPTAIDTMVHAVWQKWITAENVKNPRRKMQYGVISNFFQKKNSKLDLSKSVDLFLWSCDGSCIFGNARALAAV